jgi:SAM-dependent methyltransferase
MSPSTFQDRSIRLAKVLLPARLRAWVVRQQKVHRLQWPRAGSVDLGGLRRVTPISPIFGFDRGLPIDRYYIERFLHVNASDIRGRTLELGDATYTRRFGGAQVDRADVLHVTAGSPEATIIADLTNAGHVPSDSFDCIIFTQSLQMIYDFHAALETLHRILRPGGVLLLTTHGISKIGRRLGRDDWGEYWHFTAQSIEALMTQHFPGASVQVTSYGNVLSAVGFLHGLAAEELSEDELNHPDPDFEVIITARAQKAR